MNLKNFKLIFLGIMLLLSFLIIVFHGVQFGIDFEGGTMFQIQFEHPVTSPEEKLKIVKTIESRLDWTGLRDTTVSFFGDEFVLAQMAETDPETIARIESLLRKQGVFEAVLDGNAILTGEDIIKVLKDSSQGYAITRAQDGSYTWTLPFVLSSKGAKSFTQGTFHRCELSSLDVSGKQQYDCDKVYFFIDRPSDALLLMSKDVFSNDSYLINLGVEGIVPQNTDIEDILKEVNTDYLVLEDKTLSDADKSKILNLKLKKAVISSDLDPSVKSFLESKGYSVKVIEIPKTLPWIVAASGLRSIVSLQPDVANMDVASFEQAKLMNKLLIRGYAKTLEGAKSERQDMEIILDSGSLSVPVKSISKEVISPFLGSNFLFYAGIIGLIALLVVALVLFIRYKTKEIIIPILLTGLSEVFITVAIVSLISKLDLGAVAGLLASVGTGVDDQIIITDEVIERRKEDESLSIARRIKKAFFIIFAAAATTIATMSPLIIMGYGLGKLVGFAITTIIGVLVGVLITRPAYGEVIKIILLRKEK